MGIRLGEFWVSKEEGIMRVLIERMLRAIRLDPSLYGEVIQQPEALSQTIRIVIISGISAGIGSLGRGGVMGALIVSIGAIISWVIWAYFVMAFGMKVMPESEVIVNQGDFFRAIGFSSAPGVIRVLGIVPYLYFISVFIGHIWMIVSMVVAVKQVLNYKTDLQAFKVCLIGWFLMLGTAFILGSVIKGIGF